MTVNSQRLLLAAAGAGGAAAENLYVDDVFSTYLYTGNGSSQTITNGIDLSGEGGLTWIKQRNGTYAHVLTDTERGAGQVLVTSVLSGSSGTFGISSFNSDGFSVDSTVTFNSSSNDFASWTFRKAPGFFDVVTWTGTGSDQTISHNLGSTPGCIIVKRTDTTSDWYVYHRSLPTATQNWIRLNNTGAANGAIGQDLWGPPTDTTFKVDTYLGLSTSGGTYVAYLFAHDDAQFGENEDESIIKCGTFTTNGSYNGSVTLGWEPQWVMVKNANATGGWFIHDTMRGAPVDGDSAWLYANATNAEVSSSVAIRPNATGFTSFNHSANTDMIYIAIRRPHKPPEAGTDVFAVDTLDGTTKPGWTSGFVVDWKFQKTVNTTGDWKTLERITGGKLFLARTDAEVTPGTNETLDYNNGWGNYSAVNSVNYSWMFRRAPGFFDMVAYSGTGSTRTIAHNLGVAPEFIIHKSRTNTSYGWISWHSGIPLTSYVKLDITNAASDLSLYPTWWLNNTSPTATEWTLSGTTSPNLSGQNYIAYLFATLAGISKVGSFSGTGSNVDVDCGFTAGARFVLVKRTDSTGDWYVYDSTRGIVSGNDPYLLLNSTAVQVTSTDYIDPLNSGFTVTSSAPAALNASGGTYIFLAIA